MQLAAGAFTADSLDLHCAVLAGAGRGVTRVRATHVELSDARLQSLSLAGDDDAVDTDAAASPSSRTSRSSGRTRGQGVVVDG